MPLKVTISSLSGTSPYNIYICDSPITNCFYISTITTGNIPYTFTIPEVLSTMDAYTLKITDKKNKSTTQTLTP
jgi:hypothetical protein